jgi:AbrB family looped-hinge helix DNA binding protein
MIDLWHILTLKCVFMLSSRTTESTRVRVDAAGRVTLPAEFRHKLGIEPGQELILAEDGLGIRLQTFAQAAHSAQEAFAPYRIPGKSVVDELIRERRGEAKREYRE